MHTHKQLTEAELRDEIAKTLDGAVSSFEGVLNGSSDPTIESINARMKSEGKVEVTVKKRRGRPPGVKNKVKNEK